MENTPPPITGASYAPNFADGSATQIIPELEDVANKLVEAIKPTNEQLANHYEKQTHSDRKDEHIIIATAGNKRMGKSTLANSLIFACDANVPCPLVAREGLGHVTNNLAVVENASKLSIVLEPLPEDLRRAQYDHVADVNKHCDSSGASLTQLPATVDELPQHDIDLLAMATDTSYTPEGNLHKLINLKDAADFIASAPLTDMAHHYRVIEHLAKAISKKLSPNFEPYLEFYILKIKSPFAAEGVQLWDTPGLGDQRFTPIIAHALSEANVIAMCNVGRPVPDDLIAKSLTIAAQAVGKPKPSEGNSLKEARERLRRWRRKPPVLLIFEEPGPEELKDYRETQPGLADMRLDALTGHYCASVRRIEYAATVMRAVEVALLNGPLLKIMSEVAISSFCEELRNILMTRPSPYNEFVDPKGPLQPVLADINLIKELKLRVSFWKLMAWLNKTARFAAEAKCSARPRSSESSDASIQFSVTEDIWEQISTKFVKEVMEATAIQWDVAFAMVDDEDSDDQGGELRSTSTTNALQKWIQACTATIRDIYCRLWTEMFSEAFEAMRQDVKSTDAISEANGNAFMEYMTASISASDFAKEQREKANEENLKELDRVYAELMIFAQEAQRRDPHAELATAVHDAALPKWIQYVESWRPYVDSISQAISLKALEFPMSTEPTAESADVVKLCDQVNKLVNRVITRPSGAMLAKSLRQTLKEVQLDKFDIPARISLRKDSRDRHLSFKWSDAELPPRTAHVGLPTMLEENVHVAVQAHPSVQKAIGDHLKKIVANPTVSLAPLFILAQPDQVFKDHTGIAAGFDNIAQEKYSGASVNEGLNSLRILLIDEPTLALTMRHDPIAWTSIAGAMLVFVIKSGANFIHPAVQLDLFQQLARFLNEDFRCEDGSIVSGSRYYGRIEGQVNRFFETEAGILLTPATPGRVLMGLQQALIEKSKEMAMHVVENLRAKFAMCERWKDVPKIYSTLAGKKDECRDVQEVIGIIQSTKHENDPVEHCKHIREELDDEDLPKVFRDDIEGKLGVQLVAVSPIAQVGARREWLAKEGEEGRQICNARVRFYKKRCTSYEQTQCVFIDGLVFRNNWVCSEKELLELSRANFTNMEKYLQRLRDAEKKFIKGLIQRRTVSGNQSTGLCALVADLYCVRTSDTKRRKDAAKAQTGHADSQTVQQAQKSKTTKAPKKRTPSNLSKTKTDHDELKFQASGKREQPAASSIGKPSKKPKSEESESTEAKKPPSKRVKKHE
eukprot:TRINITY_DN4575_c0_g1_i1.p1 TRINITY_DN4575_c0_g1~~TRINITY_DN4575_c0_g1_i1.p1  ORF type:complete len:1253 (+),score=279.52 TRINITY_DN4575_c0_g1_i1:46-3804(+)